MARNRQHDRGYTLRLKYMIVRKIGHERAQKYFDQLIRLFEGRISKSEFDEECIRLIGRETLRLHNELIRSILNKACCARERPAVIGRGKLGGGKFRDRPSPLGPHGKTQNAASKESAPKLQSPPELQSIGSRPPVLSVEDGEEVEQSVGSPGVQSENNISAPLGVSVDFRVGPQTLSEYSQSWKFDPESCQNSRALPSTTSLNSTMDRKLEMEGINVSFGCANLLNSALDVYLKGLIGQAMNIARSKKRDAAPCRIIEVAPGKFVRILGNPSIPLSMLDLRNAAELNLQMLGQNWPVQLEKMLTHSFDRTS
ncbi:hypothetical protein MLD38_032135 [Melastoma candidum]|uniref:Uncharacterized protein n=1 Tax=Melastoma candidum TaxID=119954 RepID=A0ACB9M2W4_9MYRT|nr:hypothetical protein MLD38_032135 [Melastoma candidum]